MSGQGIDDPQIAHVLAREHECAEGDGERLAAVHAEVEKARAAGREAYDIYPKDVYLAVKPDMGRFLYLAALSIRARGIVEFGTSLGISTIYLAAAAVQNGGRVTGSEFEPSKAEKAMANLKEAGLDNCVDILVGDALETLAGVKAPVDLLFLDGAKDLYVPVLQMIEPKLRPGALVLADNIFTAADRLKPYLEYVNRTAGPWRSMVIPFESGLGYSVYRP